MKELLFDDDFSKSFDVGNQNKWYYMSMGEISMSSDEYELNTDNGLLVRPKGRNTVTGEPAFTVTSPPSLQAGQVDHIKWSVLASNKSKTGLKGFDVKPGCKISFEAIIGGKTYGNENHPFGSAVDDYESDLRLGDAVLMLMDPMHMIVFDFFITNTKIYAIYERGMPMGGDESYQSYSFGVPLADRNPDDTHLVKITYDYDTNTVSWFIENEEVFKTGNVGKLIDRQYMYIDNGGEAKEVRPEFFQAGLALFTLMDGSKNGVGLINLTGEDIYYNPLEGEPVKATFIDNESLKSNRLFGQGAELLCKKFSVYYE